MKNKSPGWAKGLLNVCLGFPLVLTATVGQAAEQEPPAHQKTAPAPKASASIPVTEVAAQAMEVSNFLRTVYMQFTLTPEIEKIQKSLPEVSRQIDLDFSDTSATLRERPPLETLEGQQGLWQRRHLQVSTWLTLLTQRTLDLQEMPNRIASLQATWTQTRETAKASEAPTATLQQIETVLNAIEAARVPLRAQYQGLLNLQINVSRELTRCDDVLSRITQAQKGAVSGILTRERATIRGVEQVVLLLEGVASIALVRWLLAWTDEFRKWRVVRSDLATAVYDAVRAAGMSFPFPQREVRVLGDSKPEETTGTRPGGCMEPAQSVK